MMKSSVTIVLILSFVFSPWKFGAPSAHAQDTSTAPSASEKPIDLARKKGIPSEDADEDDDDEEVQKLKQRNKDYRKSRLTSDRSEGEADHRVLPLCPGQEKIIDLDFQALKKEENGIGIGNSKVVNLTTAVIGDKTQLIFKPLQPGQSSVSIREPTGAVKIIFDVNVSNSCTNALLMTDLKELLKEIEGLQFKLINDRIVIDGEVLVPGDYARLTKVINDPMFKGKVSSYVVFSPIALNILARRIKDESEKQIPGVRLTSRVVNSQIWIEGHVDSDDQIDKIKQIANLLTPEVRPPSPNDINDEGAQKLKEPRDWIQIRVIKNDIGTIAPAIAANPAPPPPSMLRFTIHFVELGKDFNRVFGFKWQPGFTANPSVSIGGASVATQGVDAATGGQTTSTSGGGDGGFSAVISNLIPKLTTAQEAGFARLLRQATVITKVGMAGGIDDSTQVPILTQAVGSGGGGGVVAGGQTTNSFTVAIPQNEVNGDEITMVLEVSVNALAGRTGNGGNIVNRHKVQTAITVKAGQSAAFGSFNYQDNIDSYNKDDPGSTVASGPNTTSLFRLLRSKQHISRKTQFVFFVTPSFINNAAEGTEDLKKNFRTRAM